MKKSALCCLIISITVEVSAQDTTYYSVLRKGIELSNQGYSHDNFLELANICERISVIKSEEWLSSYYGAFAYINMSFIETKSAGKSEYCKKAKNLLEKTKELNPESSEPNVLEALYCYAMMEITPMVNGPIYLPKSKKALETAKEKNPENPRIYYLEGKSTMYMPSFMGGGKDIAVPFFEKAMELFEQANPESDVHPSWGKNDSERLLKECRSHSE